MSLIYTRRTKKETKESATLVNDLREIFCGVSEKLVRTIVLAADGDKILAYNALLFYTEGHEIYKEERLPLEVVASYPCMKGKEKDKKSRQKNLESQGIVTTDKEREKYSLTAHEGKMVLFYPDMSPLLQNQD